MPHNYRFRIHKLAATTGRLFQLRVGMEGEKDFELVPVHRTAFAEHLDLEAAHASAAEVHMELTSLLHWIEGRGERLTRRRRRRR